MEPRLETARARLTDKQTFALSIALHHGMERTITVEELHGVQARIERSLTQVRDFIYTAAGELSARLYEDWHNDQLVPTGGTHTALTPPALLNGTAAGRVFASHPIPDLVAGYILSRYSEDAFAFGHLPAELTPNEEARLLAAYTQTLPDTKAAAGMVSQAKLERLLTFNFGRVLRGEAVLRVPDDGTLHFIAAEDLADEQQAAYLDARQNAGLERRAKDPPISEAEFKELTLSLRSTSATSCDGHLTRVSIHLQGRNLPVLPTYQSLMRNRIFCDCIAAKAARYAPTREMWPDQSQPGS